MIKETQLEFGEALRDLGLTKVLRNTPSDYREKVDAAILKLARSGWKFTAEDVREIAGSPPNSPNTLGALMHAAVKSGVIKGVGYQKANRARSHARVIQVYVGCDVEVRSI